MKWKFWKKNVEVKETITKTFTHNESLTASIQVGCNPDSSMQYIHVTAVDNQRAIELFKAVREELRVKKE